MEDGSILTQLNSQLKLLSAVFSWVRIAVVFAPFPLGSLLPGEWGILLSPEGRVSGSILQAGQRWVD